MIVDYYKLNQVVTPIIAAVADFFSLFFFFWSKPAPPGTKYPAIDFVNILFSPLYSLVVKTNKEAVSLQLTRPAIYLHCSIWVIHQYFSLCHNLIYGNLTTFPFHRILIWSITSKILYSCKQKVATI